MPNLGVVSGILALIGISAMGARAQGDFDSLEGDAWTAAHAAAAEKQFAVWKETGKAPEELLYHAMRGERPDLQERVLSGDRLTETEIKAEMPAIKPR